MFTRSLLPLECVTPTAQGVIATTKRAVVSAWPWLAEGDVGYSSLTLCDQVASKLEALGYGVQQDPEWHRWTIRWGRAACVTGDLHIRHELHLIGTKMPSAWSITGLAVISSCEQLDMLSVHDPKPVFLGPERRRSLMDELLDPLGIGCRIFNFEAPLIGLRKRWLLRVARHAEALGVDSAAVFEARCALLCPTELQLMPD